jgi:hypothetical protein
MLAGAAAVENADAKAFHNQRIQETGGRRKKVTAARTVFC